MKLLENIYFYEGDYTKKTQLLYRGAGSSNFLVITNNKQILIDSGTYYGPHRRRIEQELRSDGIILAKTNCIILSHSHPDHILLAKHLSKKHNIMFMMHKDAEVLVRRDSYHFEAFYNFPEFILKEILDLPIWFARLTLKKMFGFDYLKIGRLLNDKEIIDFGTKLQVISLQSHSLGHIGIYFPKEKILYSSDLFDHRTAGGVIVNNALASYGKAFTDIDRVKKLDIQILIPGHGQIIRGKKNIEKILELISTSTRDYLSDIIKNLEFFSYKGITINKLTDIMFKDSIVYNKTSRRMIVYNCLNHLQLLGKVKYKLQKNKACWFIT